MYLVCCIPLLSLIVLEHFTYLLYTCEDRYEFVLTNPDGVG